MTQIELDYFRAVPSRLYALDKAVAMLCPKMVNINNEGTFVNVVEISSFSEAKKANGETIVYVTMNNGTQFVANFESAEKAVATIFG